MIDQDRAMLRSARLAGAMYLLGDTMLEVGNLITSRIAGEGSFIDIAHRIAAAEGQYRLGLTCQIVTTLSLIWLAVSFYSMLKRVDPKIALVAMLAWVVESGLSALINLFDFLSLRMSLNATKPGADVAQLAALGDLADRASGLAFNLGVIVFSMGSILFYALFLKSRYLPRAIAGFDLLASALVLLVGFVRLLDPVLAKSLGFGFIPMSIAEFGTGLWLLIVGTRIPPMRTSTASRAA